MFFRKLTRVDFLSSSGVLCKINGTMTVSHMLTVKAAAALILAGSATAMQNLESKLADGPAQTYWW